jgi:tetratricopeptide (TPR) repeat protein
MSPARNASGASGMWNPFAGLMEAFRQQFNPSVRKAWLLNLDVSKLIIDGKFREATEGGGRALALNEALYGPSHPQVAEALENLGMALDYLGQAEKAKPLFERARAIYEAAYGPSHPKVASALNNLGHVAHEMGDLPQAKALLERVLSMSDAFSGTEQLEGATAHRYLGELLEEMGDLPAARVQYEQALAITERCYGEEDRFPVAFLSEKLGKLLHRLGEDAGANALLTPSQMIKDREAEANRVSQVQNLGRVRQQGKALSYTLH